MRSIMNGLRIVCVVGLSFAGAACGDDPSDIGQACSRHSDCEKMCKAVCDPSPCTDQSTNFRGECSDSVQCSIELDSQGKLSPTVCP